MTDISARQRHVGGSRVSDVVGRSIATALVGAVLSGCGLFEHHSDPAPTSGPPASSHAGPGSAPPPTTTVMGSVPGGASAALGQEFTKLEHTLNATMGIVISAVGTNPTQLVFGDWTTGPAWSTSKVPLMIAALGQQNPPTVTDSMTSAITKSDNAAAESVWEQLGDPVTAEHKVEAVLRKYGDPTTVEWQKKRPEFTAFGQTIWSLSDQARFTAGALCDKANTPIFTLMGQVEGDQSWGLGTIPDTQFKGGWGPSTTGSYLVRQLGVLKSPAGLTAVAVAAQPASGGFSDGTHELTEVAKWLTSHQAELPVGHCDH